MYFANSVSLVLSRNANSGIPPTTSDAALSSLIPLLLMARSNPPRDPSGKTPNRASRIGCRALLLALSPAGLLGLVEPAAEPGFIWPDDAIGIAIGARARRVLARTGALASAMAVAVGVHAFAARGRRIRHVRAAVGAVARAKAARVVALGALLGILG